MRVKTFSGKTEFEAMEVAKNELGQELTVISVKKISKNSMLPFFNKSRFEVTAAVDNNLGNNQKNDKVNYEELKNDLKVKEQLIVDQSNAIEALNDKITKSNELIGSLSKDIMEVYVSSESSVNKYESESLKEIYKVLRRQEIVEPLVEWLLHDLAVADTGNISRDVACKHVFDKIVNVIGVPETIDNVLKSDSKTPILFMGPTGVGKTTTIAKLASDFILEREMMVGLLTADTFRIAAIEQLKTYAEILNIEVGVVYNKEDMITAYNKMSKTKDIILIDTAGRSHKAYENVIELKEYVSAIPNMKKYLVLSLTTKVEDLLEIVNTYSSEFDFDLIFTKLDETTTYGSILNLCYITKKNVSYINYGQTVPNDIKVINPKEIASSILGWEVQ